MCVCVCVRGETGESDRQPSAAAHLCSLHQAARVEPAFSACSSVSTPEADVDEFLGSQPPGEKTTSRPLLYFRQITLRTIELNDHVDRLHWPKAALVGELESPAKTNNGAHWSKVLKINSSVWQVEDHDWIPASSQSVLHSQLSFSTYGRSRINRSWHFDSVKWQAERQKIDRQQFLLF